MCGIAGITLRDEAVIRRMTTAIAHRGPDAEHVWLAPDAELALGHRRLSILDLHARGDQPMTYRHAGREVVITFNGEIYNFRAIRTELEALGHRFSTTTDTEVILAAYLAWGPACVKRFNGMWAFAIWDPSTRQLFLSRDRFGKKPLYLFHSGSTLIFASEIKAILQAPDVPRRANRAMLGDYLLRGLAAHTTQSYFDGIESLPAACSAHFALHTGALSIERYWEPPVDERTVGVDEFRETLRRAVERRTIADVPVSLSLSGGIDSSSIAALLAQESSGKMAAFTTISASGVGDETPLVKKLLARYPRYDLHVRVLDEQRFVDDSERIVHHMEEPLWSDAPYVRWEIASDVHAHDYKVLITGEGADEALGGYWMAGTFYLRDLARTHQLVRLASEIAALVQQPDAEHILRAYPSLLVGERWRPHRRSDELARSLGVTLEPAHPDPQAAIRGGTTKDYLRWALGTFILPELLVCNDRMSMAHSVESRAPFLDVDFVEMALSIRTSDLIEHGRRKYPLRRAMHGLVPDEILYRRKKDGFASPMTTYLRAPAMKQRFERYFGEPRTSSIVDARKVLAHHRAHGMDELSARLFWIESWARVFDVTIA